MASREAYKRIPKQDLSELRDMMKIVNKAYVELGCDDAPDWECSSCNKYMVCRFYAELLNKLDEYTLLGEFINTTKQFTRKVGK